VSGGFVHAGVDGEDIDQAGDGKNPEHLTPWRGQEQVTAGVPGQLPAPSQRSHAAGVDELQPGQIDDDLRLASHDQLERCYDSGGV
jgi:hypothetical protein